MATVGKGTDQSVQEMTERYTATDQGEPADVSPGTVNRDLIDSVASQVSSAFDEIESVRLFQSLKNADLVSSDGLSQIGLTYDVVRLDATKATGTVYFQRKTVPTKIIDFPIGTVVQTTTSATGATTKFVTLTAAQLSTTTTQNPANRLWEASASIIAVVAGSAGNVGPGAINQLETINRNIDSIVNKEATTGGEDVEANTDFATRIRAKTAGSSVGTESGYISKLKETFAILTDVAVAGPGDPAMVRDQFGNEIDIYLRGSSNASFQDIMLASGQTTDNIATAPVAAITSVVGTTTGTIYAVGTDVVLTPDTGPVYGYSTNAFDKLTWQTSNRPWAGQRITVTGEYDVVVNQVQDYLDSDDNRFVTADTLAKAGARIGIVVQASAVSFAGYDRTTLATTVQTALSDGLTQYALGQDVLQSDIVNIISSVAGIDEVSIPLTELRRSTDASGTVSDSITINKNNYARLNSATITVT